MTDKLISQQAAIEAVEFGITYAKAIDTKTGEVRELFKQSNEELRKAVERIKALPSAQPDIIRCKDCKHWNPQLKTANGNGLGSCDFHNVALVTSEGFCYWAERGEQNDSEAD